MEDGAHEAHASSDEHESLAASPNHHDAEQVAVMWPTQKPQNKPLILPPIEWQTLPVKP